MINNRGRIRANSDFGSSWFCTSVVSLVYAGSPPTLAIAQESQVSHYKGQIVRLHGDICTQRVIHLIGQLFFVATLLNHDLHVPA